MGVLEKTEEYMEKETVKQSSYPRVSPYLQMGRLPRLEAWFNIIAWSGFVAYFCYSTYWASQEYVLKTRSPYLVPGYSFLGRMRDESNGEWEFMRGWSKIIWPWFSIHIVLSLITRRIAFEYRFYILAQYGAVIVLYLMGYMAVLFLTVQCLVMFLVATVFRSALAVWAASGGFLVFLNTNRFIEYLLTISGMSTDEPTHYYLILYALLHTNTCYTSFCLEQCKHLQESEGKGEKARGRGFSFIDMLVYIFYLPVLFSGPLMTYDQFLLQTTLPRQPWTKSKVVNIVKDCLRVAFWILFIEITLHYFYFSALMSDPEVMDRLPRWALVGVGYCCGQFFMVKYVVVFGLPKVMTEFDQIKSADRPKCISRIYLYSEMWKKFDVGLYHFIKRHIYVPVGGSRHGLLRQIIASFLCFVFVFMWHGMDYGILIWTILNYLGILLEAMASQVTAIPSVKAFERRLLSPTNSRRLRAFVTIPSFAMSIFAIFVFFGGAEVAPIYYNKIACYGPAIVAVTAVLYTYIQSSVEIAIFEAEKGKQN
ncbi:hypothetical protein NP493_734g02018 [Ridgeia piscesae]|uniref:Uncharacterized protein n=1 Tax=Ridgeia piscesae TaxID=27915 RepID=A0AAD9KRL7_RIDPI|nr:hypothetical protein NP493_734g02018 [Ridgeia piscesae]